MEHPGLSDLRALLINVGGIELVPAPGGVDNGISLLVAEGEVMSGPVTLDEMAPSHCHANIARQWLARRAGLTGICLGYALGDDGFWRQHWWGELAGGGILETTMARAIYFGVVLQDPQGVSEEILREFGPK